LHVASLSLVQVPDSEVPWYREAKATLDFVYVIVTAIDVGWELEEETAINGLAQADPEHSEFGVSELMNSKVKTLGWLTAPTGTETPQPVQTPVPCKKSPPVIDIAAVTMAFGPTMIVAC